MTLTATENNFFANCTKHYILAADEFKVPLRGSGTKVLEKTDVTEAKISYQQVKLDEEVWSPSFVRGSVNTGPGHLKSFS